MAGTRCTCVSVMLLLYTQLETAVGTISPDSLLDFIDRVTLRCRIFLSCTECQNSTFALATVSAMSHQLVETISSFYSSSTEVRAILDETNNGIYLDSYRLRAAESTLLFTQLLHVRLQKLESLALLPISRVAATSADQSQAAALNTVHACQTTLKETAELITTLQTRFVAAASELME